jgi:hypothetical protein
MSRTYRRLRWWEPDWHWEWVQGMVHCITWLNDGTWKTEKRVGRKLIRWHVGNKPHKGLPDKRDRDRKPWYKADRDLKRIHGRRFRARCRSLMVRGEEPLHSHRNSAQWDAI